MFGLPEATVLKEEILERVEDIVDENPVEAALGMCLASLAILHDLYPAKLSATAVKQIKENYPDATDELIADRAMSEEGALIAIRSNVIASQIAMDYSPLSHTKAHFDSDMKLSPESMRKAQHSVSLIFEELEGIGLSPFGAVAMVTTMAVQYGGARGLHGLQMVRPLLENIGQALENLSPEFKKMMDDRALEAVAQQLGISKQAAKNMVKGVRRP
ncbi:TPA: hypothetical protein ACP3ZG_001621 [Pseudomonas aeruginosa]|uniref:Uncharacterized protein n=1 Tax=Pseudomonas aeruginosa TaxID=287 RepID=A0A241XS39_PSEAI|nr:MULTISPECIES: hypothetical protein [Pseudomonas]ELG7182128.1 hypothetical protein [Pseudomonas aeruginosa]ELH1095476.1 hypothetical protein [Pseudomonas aeruginosa]ELL4401162.1 hypothetical protein [Pseudomonas aeruginosa]MBH4094985.1 hypothetical protein [Pseudomonas aeruginosa]MBI6603298.1 hypothetical protein [Pseudomonas sp. S4_EA_1b]